MEVGALLLSTSVALALVHLGRDGVGNVGELLLLLLKVLGGGLGAVLLEPLSGLLDSLEDLNSVSDYEWDMLWVPINLPSPCPRRRSCHQDHPHRSPGS